MGYAAFIMGNSQKQFARRSMVIHTKNPQPLTNILDCFVPMYSGDYIVEGYTLNIGNVI